jgi:hypothetical protein
MSSPRSQIRDIRDSDTKISYLLNDLDNKNHEIVSLNKRIREIEKTKNEILLDMEKFENDFLIAEKKYNSRENELLDRINILEMEVNFKFQINNFFIL